nr:response regulator [Desulfobacterales bacterium]
GELKFRDIFDNMFQYMGVVTTDGTILAANKASVNASGIHESDFVGNSLWESPWFDYSSDSIKLIRETVKQASSGKLVRLETMIRLKDNNMQYIDYSLNPITNEDGNVFLLIAEGRDTTPLKLIENELKKAKDAAEIATRTKSEFLANMSHEIRTPMNGIITASDLALHENVSPKLKHFLEIIHDSAYSLLGIINDILDVSKIEAGKLQLEAHPFKLDDILTRVMDMFVNQAAEKRIELLLDIGLKTPNALIGDSIRLEQIIINLLSNAIKFTGKDGNITTGVSFTKKTAERVMLKFFVKDTGAGIAPEYIDKLFESFSQEDGTTTRKYGGTGLGLSISKMLVEMMGGTIWVESKQGKGSIFHFTVSVERQSQEPGFELILPPAVQGRNVLVVDDTHDSIVIMQNMLESFGFRVKTVSSAVAALKMLANFPSEKCPFDLVIMDLLMPELDGIEAIKIIKTDFNLTIPTILMAAAGHEEKIMYAEKIGIGGFLTKPVNQSDLFNEIMYAFGAAGLKQRRQKKLLVTRTSVYKKRLKGKRILVVEDNSTNQEIVRAVLEGAGVIVEVADNGQIALDFIKKSKFDAVLMDIQMPVMDGYEATRKIRKDPAYTDLPIIAMTAHAMKGDEEQCLKAGMTNYVSKPIDQEKFFRVLWGVLKKESATERVGENITQPELPVITDDIKDSNLDEILPAELPGINLKKILTGMELDPKTFKRILIGFFYNNQNIINKLNAAFIAKNQEELKLLSHTLKGSSASIGAEELSERAGELESFVKQNKIDDPVQTLINQVKTALGRVFDSLQLLLDKADSQKTIIDIKDSDPVQLKAAAHDLAEALDMADPDKIEISLEKIKEFLGGSVLDQLVRYITGYDYDDAKEILEKI